ncbi:MAG TPA: hypothetical protein VK028_14320 [Micromonosporaceae bacterium]|nr:hypothetical protein [Micromonosporaceae bacterium]
MRDDDPASRALPATGVNEPPDGARGEQRLSLPEPQHTALPVEQPVQIGRVVRWRWPLSRSVRQIVQRPRPAPHAGSLAWQDGMGKERRVGCG